MVRVGHSAVQDHWKVNISEKQGTWSHLVNKILLIVVLLTMVVTEDGWITRLIISKLMGVSILKPAILITQGSWEPVITILPTLGPLTQVQCHL